MPCLIKLFARHTHRHGYGARSAIRTVRSFAGEGLERERFAEHVAVSQRSGISFAQAKATLESLNRCDPNLLPKVLLASHAYSSSKISIATAAA